MGHGRISPGSAAAIYYDYDYNWNIKNSPNLLCYRTRRRCRSRAGLSLGLISQNDFESDVEDT